MTSKQFITEHAAMTKTTTKKKKKKYSKKAGDKVAEALHKEKRGKLKSGRSGVTVKSRKQAIAIGLSEARGAGAKVPAKKKSATKKKKSATKKKVGRTRKARAED